VHPEATTSASFDTVTIDTPVYLPYLAERFRGAGGSIIKASIQHIDQLVEGGTFAVTKDGSAPNPPDAIVVCAGLGARSLGGVEDLDVHPVRGQTVILRAPWVKSGITVSSAGGDGKEEFWTYVIPRRSGDVVVGGTKGVDDW
jgi:D-amino-acid oxidase